MMDVHAAKEGKEEIIGLRPVQEKDLPTLFVFQLDEEANHMAAFTADDPADETAFRKHWERLLNNQSITARAIVSITSNDASESKTGEEVAPREVLLGTISTFPEQITPPTEGTEEKEEKAEGNVQKRSLELTYWLGKEFWGRGYATRALELMLQQTPQRPLFARAAKDNTRSLRVLEKCGFRVIGEDKGYANARKEETEEFVLKLGH